MRKVPTLFTRNTDNMKEVTDQVNPEALWLFDPSVPRRATVKKDGTNVLIVGRELGPGAHYNYSMRKRRNPSRAEKEAAKRQGRPVPEPHYVDTSRDDPQDKHIYRAFDACFYHGLLPQAVRTEGEWPAEALGKKIQGGVEGEEYRLYFFTVEPEILDTDPLIPTYDGNKAYFAIFSALTLMKAEGIVWQATDGSGRMAKVKRRDFGLKWPV